MVETRFDCPAEVKEEFAEMCAERGKRPGAVLRELMLQELKEWTAGKNHFKDIPDQVLITSLRKRVARVWSTAKNWDDFIAGLERDALLIRPSGAGLILCSLGNGRKLANASQVGPGYRQMVKRFGCGFPNHPQPHIAAMVLGGKAPLQDLFDGECV